MAFLYHRQQSNTPHGIRGSRTENGDNGSQAEKGNNRVLIVIPLLLAKPSKNTDRHVLSPQY